EVLVKACLVNGVDWSQTHGYGRELPEPIHTAWGGVGRPPLAWAAWDFLTGAAEVIVIQTAFRARTCGPARRGVSLGEDLVAARWIVLAAEEVVKANFIQRSSTGIGRDVATDANAWALLTVHHDGRIPTNPATITFFQFLITRELRLHGGGDGVNEVSRR